MTFVLKFKIKIKIVLIKNLKSNGNILDFFSKQEFFENVPPLQYI